MFSWFKIQIIKNDIQREFSFLPLSPYRVFFSRDRHYQFLVYSSGEILYVLYTSKMSMPTLIRNYCAHILHLAFFHLCLGAHCILMHRSFLLCQSYVFYCEQMNHILFYWSPVMLHCYKHCCSKQLSTCVTSYRSKCLEDKVLKMGLLSQTVCAVVILIDPALPPWSCDI